MYRSTWPKSSSSSESNHSVTSGSIVPQPIAAMLWARRGRQLAVPGPPCRPSRRARRARPTPASHRDRTTSDAQQRPRPARLRDPARPARRAHRRERHHCHTVGNRHQWRLDQLRCRYRGLRLLRLGIETHLITSHHALRLLIRRPGGLVIEMTDGTVGYNAAKLPRLRVLRPRDVGDPSPRVGSGPRARPPRRHRRRAHPRMAAVRDDARALRRDRGQLA